MDASVGRSSHILIAAAGKLEPGAIRDRGGLVLLRLHMFVNAQLNFGVFLHLYSCIWASNQCVTIWLGISGVLIKKFLAVASALGHPAGNISSEGLKPTPESWLQWLIVHQKRLS